MRLVQHFWVLNHPVRAGGSCVSRIFSLSPNRAFESRKEQPQTLSWTLGRPETPKPLTLLFLVSHLSLSLLHPPELSPSLLGFLGSFHLAEQVVQSWAGLELGITAHCPTRPSPAEIDPAPGAP